MSSQLHQLQRHYAALSPTTPHLIPSPPFPGPRELCAPSTQAWLVEHLLAGSGDNEESGGGGWRKVWWRRVVKGIEQGFAERQAAGEGAEVEDEEVHEAILEELVKHLSSAFEAENTSLLRTYFWGPLDAGDSGWEKVQTREEGRMISGGTTGLRTWQACICLSNHFIASPSFLCPSPSAPTKILELGAGVGLLSLVAGRLAPKSRIVATDVDERVLQQLTGNVALNNLQSRVSTRSLDWELASMRPERKAELEAWEDEAFGEGGRADLIIGADIVYDPSLATLLASTLSYLLRPFVPSSAPRSLARPEAIIAGTIRNLDTWLHFLACCHGEGLSVTPVELLTPGKSAGIVGAEGWEGEGEVRVVRVVRDDEAAPNVS